jgi:hypothetical protein
VLCRNVIAQFGFRAENNGAKNTILHPRWNRFWTTELFDNAILLAQQAALSSSPEPPPAWPRRFGAIPPLAAAWQDRPVNEQLSVALAEGGTAVVCQILSGMGGVGKTQIAAHYARQRWNRHEVDLLLWIDAATCQTVSATYAQAGIEFCDADPSDSDQAARYFLDWLDGPDAPRWLIVLDDLNDPNDLRGLWPPANERGRTIVTTRRRDAALEAHTRTRIDVDLYTPEQGLSYLTDRLAQPHLLDGAADLAHDLGYLPLALSQAAVYILDQPGMTCASYRDLLADRTSTLEQLSPELLPDEYPHTVAAALMIAIEHADQYEPIGLASLLLAIASLLDPSGIPADLFTALRITLQPDAEPTHHQGDSNTGPLQLSTREVTDTLARLHRLNLIDHGGTTIRVHALVQRTRRDQLDGDLVSLFAHFAASALNEIWPEFENDPVRSAALRANVTRLRGHAETALFQGEANPVLFRQGNSLGDNGLVSEACRHFDLLHELCNDALGPDHPHTLAARGNLAAWRGESGDADGAATAYAELVADFLRVLGPDHPHTLTARSNLASMRGAAGNAAGAVVAFAELLTDLLRVLGPDHPYTLTTRSNLATWHGEAGDVNGAVAAYAELLNDRLRILGPDHPDTLATRGNFARWRGEAGDASGAAAAYAELLNDRLRILGPDHPDTLIARSNLAAWRGEAGDPSGAVIAFEDLLADFLRILGPDHPHTLTARSNLARWCGEAGDASTAATTLEKLLIDFLRVLGPDHPNTLTTRNNLAAWRGNAGDAAGAATAYAELLTDLVRILGPDHPDTLTARGNLATWCGEAGDATGAAITYAVLLRDFLRILGPNHPHTLTARGNLARWRGEAGDVISAVATYEDLLTDLLRILGPDDPHTLTTRGNLASMLGKAGDTAGAKAVYEELLADFLRVLGPDHPHTLTTRGNLAGWCGEAGDARGAAASYGELLTDLLRIHGPNHPQTLSAEDNLTFWRSKALSS